MKKTVLILTSVLCVLLASCANAAGNSDSNNNNSTNEDKNYSPSLNSGIYYCENEIFKEHTDYLSESSERTCKVCSVFNYDEYDSSFAVKEKKVKCNDNAVFYLYFDNNGKEPEFYLNDYINSKRIELSKASKTSNVYKYLFEEYKKYHRNDIKEDINELPYNVWICNLNFINPENENYHITDYKYKIIYQNPSDNKRIEKNFNFKIRSEKIKFDQNSYSYGHFKYTNIYPVENLKVSLKFDETNDYNALNYNIDEPNSKYTGKLELIKSNVFEIPGNYNYKTGLDADGYSKVKVIIGFENGENYNIYKKDGEGKFIKLEKENDRYYLEKGLEKIYVSEIYDFPSLNKNNPLYSLYKDNMYQYYTKWIQDENYNNRITYILNTNTYTKTKYIYDYPDFFFNEKGYINYKENVIGYEDREEIRYAGHDNEIELYIENEDSTSLTKRWIYKLDICSTIFFDEKIYKSEGLYSTLYK